MAGLVKWRSPTIIEMEGDVNDREEKFPPVHPGEILLEDFLKPMGITPYRLAKELNVPKTRISAILKGQKEHYSRHGSTPGPVPWDYRQALA